MEPHSSETIVETSTNQGQGNDKQTPNTTAQPAVVFFSFLGNKGHHVITNQEGKLEAGPHAMQIDSYLLKAGV